MSLLILSLLLISCVLFCVAITKAAVGPGLWMLSPPGIYCGYYLLRSMPGVIDAAVSMDSARPLLAHIFCFLGISVGVIFASSGMKKIVVSRGDLKLDNSELMWLFVIAGVASVVFTFLMLGRIPLLYGVESIFGSSDMGMQTIRRMNTLEHRDGDTFYFGQGYFRILYTEVAPFFVGVLAIRDALITGGLRKRYYLLMILFVIFGALNGQIWVALEIAILFFIFILFYQYISADKKSGGNVIFRVVGGYCFALAFIFGFRYLQMLGGRAMDSLFISTFERIFSYEPAPLFEIFPNRQAYRLGSTWLNDLAGILPGSSQSFAYEVHYLVNGGAWGFTLSPGIVGSSYVNFSFFGVFVTCAFLTFIYLKFFFWSFRSRRLTRVSLALFCSYSFAMAFDADIPAFLVGLITTLMIYLAYYLPRRLFSKKSDIL